jgi:UDP-2,3-diacylglucosamine pyrophosphatase LpxH
VRRILADDTLLVFLSDCHIGGDEGHDIFETPDDLASLFDTLDDHTGPVELVLAGDFFDFLRIVHVPEGEDRASATIARPEYRDLFAALRRFAAGHNRRVVYLPGNHDAEMWWNRAIHAALRRHGLVHEYALSYTASFQSDPGKVIYCEHGNQFDPANTIVDYEDRLDTPLGTHIVTDVLPQLPHRRANAAVNLRDIDRVFPLTTIPEWLAGRLFYDFVTQYVRWLLLPFVAVYVVYEVIARALGGGGDAISSLIVELGSDVLLLSVFALVLFIARRMANKSMRSVAFSFPEAVGSEGTADTSVEKIRRRLEAGESPPMNNEISEDIAIFVSGHTHAPSLNEVLGRSGNPVALVNSGCWLRQLQPVSAHLGAPTVFVSRFVQTHVRLYRNADAIQIELWEHPRPSPRRLGVAERVAAAGRLPAQPKESEPPRVRAHARIDRTAASRP